MRASSIVVLLVSSGALALGAACGSSGGDTIPPADGGGPADATVDREGDASPADAGTDAVADGGLDAGADADSGPSKTCTAGGGECAADEYCDAPDCATGTCAKRPASSDVFKAVCGCDGISYWNAGLAGAASVAVKANGACATGTKICGGIAALKCPTGASCVMEGADQNACLVADGAGKCWALPAACPAVAITSYRNCTKKTCSGLCEAMKSGNVFYGDNTCPQ